MALNNPAKELVPFNLHETPEEATVALCRRYPNHVKDKVWEPACGWGKISKVLLREFPGLNLISSDLVFRDYGFGGVDFTTIPIHHFAFMEERPSIITNPPFDLAVPFIRKAHEIEAPFIALLLKSQFWNASTRLELFREFPPKAHHPLTWRLDFHGLGNPVMDCQWIIWGRDVPFANDPLPKPKIEG